MIDTFYIILFLLFFAVLAAGYFYLKRAQARDATPADAPEATPAAAEQGTGSTDS